MKKNFLIISFLLLTVIGCKKDSEFLDVEPTSLLTNEQAFSDPAQVLSVIANLYNRQVDFSSFRNDWRSFADFSESFPSENGQAFIVQRNEWGYGDWATYDYAYIRDLNLFIQRATAATTLSVNDQTRFIAEARFLRANYYFEMVKRMGGVPLILESLEYNFSGDPTYLQKPRAKESELYDFVISEAEEIKDLLPLNAAEKARATKGAALAMEARAALYAASISKYGVNTPQVMLSGGEVGIPASMASAYYTKALSAAQEIINGSAGAYALYQKNADLSVNFASLFIDNANKNGNSETIFIEDYKVKSGKTHGFTTNNQPRFGAEEEEGGRINPSLNLVQSFEKLDNTFAPLEIDKFYTNQADIFAGRDARLSGTVLLPGTTFKGREVDIWAGYQLANGSIVTGDDRGKIGDIPGGPQGIQIVGFDGPVNAKEFTAQSGFYLRKYVDPTAGAGSRGTGSEVAFIRYRYAEVLLNAAEAAFELGQPDVAAGYMNQVRARAGLIIPLAPGEITFDRIVHERRVELAFEGHILFDMKRWRIAHIVWDGNRMTVADLVSNIGKATKRNTQPYGLWSYKLYDPSSANNGKWTYKIILPGLVTGANNFRLGNYYSSIDDNTRANNPLIVRQPNQ
ncbi:MAG: RagB/SusD family nutrient uptake outer membrane protein [Chitinophagaceae bacterium]|nr:RagB/SusD family nutrient uptake outer membrane protein [Chitinophagaceae bacterium]